jgi:hypothetical protein
MTILSEILAEIKSHESLQQMREMCDKIQAEEEKDINEDMIELLPRGPNIFLSLQVPGRTKKEYSFLTLERESEDVYIIGHYVISIFKLEESPKRQRVWQINDHRVEKIITEYAKKYKFLKGE